MKCKVSERSTNYIRYENEAGFLSIEVVEDVIIFDSKNAPDLDFSASKIEDMVGHLLSFVKKADSFVPFDSKDSDVKPYIIKKGDKFVAINRKTNRKALTGGVCECVSVTKKYASYQIAAIDACGEERKFSTGIWRISPRD